MPLHPVNSLRFSSFVVGSIAVGATALASWITIRHLKNFFKKDTTPSFKLGNSVHVIDTPEEWSKVHQNLIEDVKTVKVLGLDCEWVKNRPVALLQLATPTGFCVLIRLFKFKTSIPDSLKSLLADKSILKVGVAVTDDAKRLLQDYGLRVSGCVDLRHMLRRVRGVFTCTSRGLRGLANGVLGVDISKDNSIRCGNWEADEYSCTQIEYAATDAAVAVDIFIQLVYAKMANSASSSTQHQKTLTANNADMSCTDGFEFRDQSEKEKDTLEEGLEALTLHKNYKYPDICQVHDSKRDVNLELLHGEFWKSARPLCQGIIDAAFANQAGPRALPSLPKNDGKVKDTNAYSVRKRPLWDNCRLEAPDGRVLCTCNSSKVNWYLDKKLADKVCDEPLTVRLKFEPSRRPQNEVNYYTQDKENLCVVCGNDKNYVRKFVIPFEYRKFMPNALKDHSSHDVLLLCTVCHRRSCDFDAYLRLQLAQECNAPVESGPAAKVTMDHEMQRVRSAGRALKVNKGSIPEHRVKNLEQILCTYFGVDNLTDDLIEQAAEVDARQTSADYVPHAKRVVQHMISNGGLLAFQARWRQHFLDTMDPQFLPAFWSVDFVPEGWTQSQSDS